MDSTHLTCVFLFMLAFCFASSDIAQDRKECTDSLIGLATCLPYVGGNAKAPTLDCCSGLKDVLKKSKKCLCVLVRDRNDPSLGLNINATLALGMPATCHAPAINVSDCLTLLHLAPHSPGAKVFEDFVNSAKNVTAAPPKGNSSTGSTGSSAKLTNEGGRRNRWLGVEIVSFIITSVMVHLALNI